MKLQETINHNYSLEEFLQEIDSYNLYLSSHPNVDEYYLRLKYFKNKYKYNYELYLSRRKCFNCIFDFIIKNKSKLLKNKLIVNSDDNVMINTIVFEILLELPLTKAKLRYRPMDFIHKYQEKHFNIICYN